MRCVTFVFTLLLTAASITTAGCGGNYSPPPDESSGDPAAPLAERAFDVDVDLPHVTIGTDASVGVVLDMRLEVRGVGPGEHETLVTWGDAIVDGRRVPVEDVSGGKTVLVESEDTWRTDRIGPIRVENTTFELFLNGEPAEGGWRASGSARESQTGLGGRFDAWRRHRVLVASTDYAIAGSIDLIEVRRDSAVFAKLERARASSDPVVTLGGGAVFLVNRLTFDNVTRLDPGDDFSVSWQSSTSPGSNPHAAFSTSEGRVYVTRYEPPFDDVSVIKAQGGVPVTTVELGELAENADGTPRPDRMAEAEGAVFVGLQDIDRTFTEYASGKLAVIDPVTDELVGDVSLPGKNPGRIVVAPNLDGEPRLYVAMAGILEGLLPRELSGGVAVVDPFARAFERWALDDDDLDANVVDVAILSATRGFALVTTPRFTSSVVAFDPSTGEVGETIVESATFIPEIAVTRGGMLAVPNRSFADPSLCVHDVRETPSRLVGCAVLELGPASVAALD